MNHDKPPVLSDVAMWHRLSGLPDNVTDDGAIVDADPARALPAEKAALRAAIVRLSGPERSPDVRSAARLAASYLLAGDLETARRYVRRGQDLIGEQVSGERGSGAATQG